LKKNPSFFAIIPATVRYDKSLPQGAKLLYGEISALTNKKGCCWAGNAYFADLYCTSERTIIEWINRLRASGHITTTFKYFPNSKKIAKRLIMLTAAKPAIRPKDNQETPVACAEDGDLVVKKTSPPGDLVVKKTSPPSSEENFLDNNTAINNTVVVVDQIPEKTEKPPPKTAATALSEEYIDKLKLHFAGLDKSLVFDREFYPKILSFLTRHDLTFDYVSWIFNFCSQKNNLRKNPDQKNLSGYLFRVLCEPRYVELYREASRPPPVVPINCPVCGKNYAGASSCPECGFERNSLHDKEKINEAKRLFSLPPDVKRAYEEELVALESGALSIYDTGIKIKALKQKYGLLKAD
jgi:ssDNA-binding Zn-finger/Zn-ribbon topoisomerase 1